MKSLELVYDAERPPDVLLPAVIADLSSGLAWANYKLQNVVESQDAPILTFTRTYRPWFIWLIGVILIPLLFLTSTATLTVVFEPTEGGGSHIRVMGKGDRYARKVLKRIEF
jgi:hypothetical protein